MLDLRQQKNRVSICLETIKTDMRFLREGQLYFNHEVLSCAMVLLIIFLSQTRINFIYVNITYVYVTQFTLAEPM